jgi:hypothetical protein
MNPSRSTCSRPLLVVRRDAGKDEGEDADKDEGAADFASSVTGGSGSAEEGDNGLLSIIVLDMVKHSVC